MLTKRMDHMLNGKIFKISDSDREKLKQIRKRSKKRTMLDVCDVYKQNTNSK